jgi:hypothetical protein
MDTIENKKMKTLLASWLGMLASAHAPSTRRKHTTAWRHWMKFISESEFSISPLQPSELNVCLWLVFLFKQRKKLSYNTIRTYLYSWRQAYCCSV